MSRAVKYQEFGGPEVLEVAEVPEPQAGPNEVRVRVNVAGLNPVDYKIFNGGPVAEAFGGTPGSGVGNDFAGVIDQVGEGVRGIALGDRVYGGKRHEAVADYVVLSPTAATLLKTPEGVSDDVAGTLVIAGRTAIAAVGLLELGPEDTVLIGGAAGGVGVLATQLAVATGATVIGTASASNHDFLRDLGAIPIAYGDELSARVARLGAVTAATDLHGTDVIEAAKELGVNPNRITAIAAYGSDAEGVRATGGGDATKEQLQELAEAIATGDIRVPIAASYPVDQVAEAYRVLAKGHVRGKIVVNLG